MFVGNRVADDDDEKRLSKDVGFFAQLVRCHSCSVPNLLQWRGVDGEGYSARAERL